MTYCPPWKFTRGPTPPPVGGAAAYDAGVNSERSLLGSGTAQVRRELTVEASKIG